MANEEFVAGRKVAEVGVYGPADIEFSKRYWDMAIVLEKGALDFMPWIRAVHKETGEVVMLNCARCAVVTLLPLGDEK